MRKLKTILQSKKFYIVSLIFLLLEMFLVIKIIRYDSVYKNGNNIIIGYVIKYEKKDNYLKIVIKGKEKIIGAYYNDKIIPNVKIGTKVKVIGIVDDPNKNTIPNTFNYQRYLHNNHIYKTIKISKINIISQSKNSLTTIKNKLIKQSKKNSYLSLFLLGDKSELEGTTYNKYKNIGVAHLLAISGMHVSVLVLLLNKILFFVKKKTRFVIVSIFLLFYAYLIGYSPSILRVVIYYYLESINNEYNGGLNSLKILYLTALVIIFINPLNIYNIGFLYSFITALSIILSKKYHHRNYFINILITTFFALLFTLPITVMINYEINLISFISNLLLIPLVSFIIFPFSLIVMIFPFLINIFGVITKLLEMIVSFLDEISFLTVIVPRLNIVIIIVYYLLILSFAYYGNYKLLLLIVLVIGTYKLIINIHSSYEIIYFDIKQGDSSLIISPNNKNVILIDTGGGYSYDISKNIILFMKSKGINKINKLIISHGDYDHIGEAINLVNNFKVEKVIFNCGPINDLEKELIIVLDKKKIKYYSCIKELNIDDYKIYFLQTKEYDNENDNSNVIYTELNSYKFMFMGDAGIEKENDILDKYNIPNIDVLKVGHHGSRTSSGKEFINEINPKYSIISVGKNNRYGHPNKEVLNNLDKSKKYRTDQDGSIMFKIKNNILEIETCSP